MVKLIPNSCMAFIDYVNEVHIFQRILSRILLIESGYDAHQFIISYLFRNTDQRQRTFSVNDGIVVICHDIDDRFILRGFLDFLVFRLTLNLFHHL